MVLPQWIEFTPEEDAILDAIWAKMGRERDRRRMRRQQLHLERLVMQRRLEWLPTHTSPPAHEREESNCVERQAARAGHEDQ